MSSVKFICPVCGKFEFSAPGDSDVCEVCGWCNDSFQLRHPNEDLLENRVSLNQAKFLYEIGRVDVIENCEFFPEELNDEFEEWMSNKTK